MVLYSWISFITSDLPIAEWNCLLQQTCITLNLLRPSRWNPNTRFYWEILTLISPGALWLHSSASYKTKYKANIGFYWQLDYYVGPALNHYWSVQYNIPQTKTEIIIDAVIFIPHTKPIKFTSLFKYFHQATSDIITLLPNSVSSNIPIL